MSKINVVISEVIELNTNEKQFIEGGSELSNMVSFAAGMAISRIVRDVKAVASFLWEGWVSYCSTPGAKTSPF